MRKFKIGDRVRPKSCIPRSYEVNMWREETGVVIGACNANPNADDQTLWVKRESDGEVFMAHEMYWNEA